MVWLFVGIRVEQISLQERSTGWSGEARSLSLEYEVGEGRWITD